MWRIRSARRAFWWSRPRAASDGSRAPMSCERVADAARRHNGDPCRGASMTSGTANAGRRLNPIETSVEDKSHDKTMAIDGDPVADSGRARRDVQRLHDDAVGEHAVLQQHAVPARPRSARCLFPPVSTASIRAIRSAGLRRRTAASRRRSRRGTVSRSTRPSRRGRCCECAPPMASGSVVTPPVGVRSRPLPTTPGAPDGGRPRRSKACCNGRCAAPS